MLVCVNKCHRHLTCMHVVEKWTFCEVCKEYRLCYDCYRYIKPQKRVENTYLDEKKE